MTCLHNHDQILEFLRKIFLKGFQINLPKLSLCFKRSLTNLIANCQVSYFRAFLDFRDQLYMGVSLFYGHYHITA